MTKSDQLKGIQSIIDHQLKCMAGDSETATTLNNDHVELLKVLAEITNHIGVIKMQVAFYKDRELNRKD